MWNYKSRYYVSTTELKHLLIGALLFVLVELSFFIWYIDLSNLLLIFLILLFSPCLFIVHELCHKFVAQNKGFWSEFRLIQDMALLTLISVLSPIKFVAPGATMIGGMPDLRSNGKISLAGPLSNLFLGGLFLATGVLFQQISTSFAIAFYFVSRFSLDLALFNMIPFGVLDGRKVLSWNREIYTIVMIVIVVSWLIHPFNPFFNPIFL